MAYFGNNGGDSNQFCLTPAADTPSAPGPGANDSTTHTLNLNAESSSTTLGPHFTDNTETPDATTDPTDLSKSPASRTYIVDTYSTLAADTTAEDTSTIDSNSSTSSSLWTLPTVEPSSLPPTSVTDGSGTVNPDPTDPVTPLSPTNTSTSDPSDVISSNSETYQTVVSTATDSNQYSTTTTLTPDTMTSGTVSDRPPASTSFLTTSYTYGEIPHVFRCILLIIFVFFVSRS